VVEQFALLRVRALYLIKEKGDAEWDAYQKQLETLRAGHNSWQTLCAGAPELAAPIEEITHQISEYETAGKQFYDGVLKMREANTEMASSAAAVLDNFGKMKTVVSDETAAIVAFTTRMAMG